MLCLINQHNIVLMPNDNTDDAKMLTATHYSIIRNFYQGLVNPFVINLKLFGIGYRAEIQGNEIVFFMHFSHRVAKAIHKDVQITIKAGNTISLSSFNKELLGQ